MYYDEDMIEEDIMTQALYEENKSLHEDNKKLRAKMALAIEALKYYEAMSGKKGKAGCTLKLIKELDND